MDIEIIFNESLIEKALLKYPLKTKTEAFSDWKSGTRDITTYYNPTHHVWTVDEKWAIKGIVLHYLEDYVDEVLRRRYGL